jgi:hypothetical protein
MKTQTHTQTQTHKQTQTRGLQEAIEFVNELAIQWNDDNEHVPETYPETYNDLYRAECAIN